MSTNIADNRQNNISDKPFIYYKELSLFDKWSIGIYLLMTIYVILQYDRIPVEYAHMMTIAYAMGLQMFAYFFLYRSLRNFRCYLIWIGFSVIHLVMYFVMKSDQRLRSLEESPVALLRNTFILLLLFQLLRFVSLKTQHMEFARVSKASDEDDLDHRKITLIDKGLFLVYAAALGALTYFSFPN